MPTSNTDIRVTAISVPGLLKAIVLPDPNTTSASSTSHHAKFVRGQQSLYLRATLNGILLLQNSLSLV